MKAGFQSGKLNSVRALDLQVIGHDLAIKWDDGRESFLPLELLRRRCPCAGCMGEKDIMGNVYKNPGQTLSARGFILNRLNPVGGYAVQPVWADGHATGIYSFDYLRRLDDEQRR